MWGEQFPWECGIHPAVLSASADPALARRTGHLLDPLHPLPLPFLPAFAHLAPGLVVIPHWACLASCQEGGRPLILEGLLQ